MRTGAEPVKPPQQRRGRGFSVVQRVPGSEWGQACPEVFVKTQRDYWCRPPWRLWRRTPTLRRELRALRALCRIGLAVPRVIDYREDAGGAELVVEGVVGALPLDEALARPEARRDRIVANAARAVALLHRSGWIHGALGDEHILVQPALADRVVLIDFEKARRNGALAGRDLARLWRHVSGLTEAEIARFRELYEAARRD